MASKMVDEKDSPYESKEPYGVGKSSDLAVTLRSLKEEIGVVRKIMTESCRHRRS